MAARYSSSRARRSPKSRPAEFSATFSIRQHARLVHGALQPEAEESAWMRSRYELKMNKDTLTITVTASDITAFKATCTMILRRADLALKVAHGSI